MILTKPKTYLLLQTLIICLLVLYQCLWLFADTVEGRIVSFPERYKNSDNGGYIGVEYIVDGVLYNEYFTRNARPKQFTNIPIKYFSFYPSYSRADNDFDAWMPSIIFYLIFFLGTTILFLPYKNTVIPDGSLFEIKLKFPFIKLI